MRNVVKVLSEHPFETQQPRQGISLRPDYTADPGAVKPTDYSYPMY